MSTKIDDNRFLDQNIKGLMHDKLFEMNLRIDQARAKSKYRNLRPSQVQVLRALRGRPMSIAEVGRRLGVSRQASHSAVSALVEHGLVKLQRIPGNERDKQVIVSAAGQRLRRTLAKALGQLEAEIASNIGRKNLELLRDLLGREWFHNAD